VRTPFQQVEVPAEANETTATPSVSIVRAPLMYGPDAYNQWLGLDESQSRKV
jgi:hypothetical protein